MELSLITPIHHLRFTELLPGRFCLANIAAESDEYLEYFAQASKNGYEVVLDNGAFEGELIDGKEYIEIAEKINPRVLVVPDLLNHDSQENLQHALAFTGAYTGALKEYELMFVPQCLEGCTKNYLDSIMVAVATGAFQWIGINRNACYNAFGKFTHTSDESINKFFFGIWADYVGILKLAESRGVRFHLLGIGNNYKLFQLLWWVSKADTSSLFFQATLNNELEELSGLLKGNVSRPCDFFKRNFHLTCCQKNIVEHNCQEALIYATAADRLRNRILKRRI